MKQLQQIIGYGHSDGSYFNPISSAKQQQSKHVKNQSLIQKCLKSIVKQKMTGNLINVQRKKKAYEQRSHSIGLINEQKLTKMTYYLHDSISNNRYSANPQQFLAPISNISTNTNTNASYNHNHHQSTISSLHLYNVLNEQKSQIGKYSMSGIKERNKQSATNCTNNSNSQSVANGNRAQISFISAIQQQNYHQEQQKQQFMKQKVKLNTSLDEKTNNNNNNNKNSKIQNRLMKLPKIRNKVVLQLPNSTLIKSIIKKSVDYNINQQLWKYLTTNSEAFRSRLSRLQSFTQSPTSQIQNSSDRTQIDQSVVNIEQSLQSSMTKQIKSSIFKSSVPSTTRESFLKYLSLLPVPCRNLLQITMSFLQIRLPVAQITITYYSNMLQQLKKVNQRGWDIVAFLFWDINRDGIVNSRDVFQRFQQYNQIEDKKQSQGKQTIKYGRTRRNSVLIQPNTKKQNLTNNQLDTDTKIYRNRKNSGSQIVASVQNIQAVLKKYKRKQQTPQLHRNSAGQQLLQAVSPTSNILSMNLVKKSLDIFYKQIQKLNNMLCSSPQPNINQLLYTNIESISFLQQLVLLNQSLQAIKYSQILPLFSVGSYKSHNPGPQLSEYPNSTNLNTNEHKLQIFSKNLNSVKCTSSYKECFISTQHNEQTRLTRQKIQQYKHELRKKRQNKNMQIKNKHEAQIKLTRQLNYCKFVESSIGFQIRQIVLTLLGYRQPTTQ